MYLVLYCMNKQSYREKHVRQKSVPIKRSYHSNSYIDSCVVYRANFNRNRKFEISEEKNVANQCICDCLSLTILDFTIASSLQLKS